MNKFPILCVLAAVAAFPQAQTPLTITQSAGSATGELRMQERRTNGQNYVGIKAPQSVATNTVWALPAVDGTTGQFLKTDGAGILGWGSGGSRIVISDYFWSQTPGGTLAAGVETITLTPCPVGVDATDTKNYAYISGGTGTAEAVQYTTSGGAGTCSSGAATGTIKVTVANSHSGAWTIANAGFREAERASTHGDILLISSIDVYERTVIEKAITLECGGGGGAQCVVTAHGEIVAIDIDLAAPVTLQNFSIMAASPQVSAGAGVRLGVDSSGNHNCGSKLDSLFIYQFYYGIHLKDGCKPVITRNEIADSTKYGIYAQNIFNPDGGDGFIAHNTIGNTPAADAAIRYESGGGLKIIDNKILNNFQWGVDLYPNSGASTGQLYITSNSFDRMKAGGIRASGTDAWYGVNVIGNIIIDAGEDGTFTCIEFANPGMVGGLFAGNMCQSGQYAVKASQGTQVKVAANTFTGSKVISSTVALDYDAPLATTHANRPSTADNGSILYCTDCTATGASGGTGAAIYRINGAWSTSPTGALQISQGGNSFGTDMLIGTNDAKDIQMRRNGALTLGVFSAQVEVYGFLGINTSGVNMRVQPSGSGIGNFGTFSNHPLGVYTDSAERWRWNAAGMFVPATTDTYDIGLTGTRIRGVYAKFGEFYKSGSTAAADYVETRKYKFKDATGSTGSWDMQADVTATVSQLFSRDNAGDPFRYSVRQSSGSLVNYEILYASIIPEKRNTGLGHSVTDATFPKLGTSSQPWSEIWGTNGDFAGDLTIDGTTVANVVNYASGTMAGTMKPLFGGTGSIGASGYSYGAAFFTASGFTLTDTTTVGYVWTATSTGGAGSWQAASGAALPVTDTTGIAKGSSDATKIVRLEVDGFTTATTRVLTPPNANATIAGLEVQQSFTAPQTVAIASVQNQMTLTQTNPSGTYDPACLVLASTDTVTSTIYGAARVCSGYESASFTDEKFAIQTATGSGTYQDALTIKNQAVTILGSIAATGSATFSFVNGTMDGTMKPLFSGNGSIGSATYKYGDFFGVRGNFTGATIGSETTTVRLGQNLDLNYSSNYAGMAINTWSATDGHGGVLDINKSGSGTIGTHAAVANSEVLGAFVFRGSDGTAFQQASQVIGEVDGAVSSGIVPGRLRIRTADTSGVMTERMRIDSAGLASFYAGVDVTGNLSAAVINATGSPAYQVSGTTVIDSSRNGAFANLTWSGTVANSITFSAGSTYNVGSTGAPPLNVYGNYIEPLTELVLGSGVSFRGSLIPAINNTYAVGNTSFRVSNVATVNMNLSGTVTAPNGNTGLSAIKTVGDGSGGSCTITISGGIITASTCP